MSRIIIILLVTALLFACSTKNKMEVKDNIELQNPIIPGYFADPSLVQFDGKFYLYATADPWGANFLACWESDDFRDWKFHKLNWPTKEACTTSLSNSNMVWAPSVIEKNGKFYMYISVGSEVWCGIADHPLGPWKNPLDDKPMIPFDTTRYYHVIDAEAFIDNNGKAYLYWGSGWGWINGRCFAAELNDDMCSFKSEPLEITPDNYFEGPLTVKYGNRYYLTYSEGKTVDDTYEVRYATSDSPLGPFIEAENSPILKTDESLSVYGPGHHTIFAFEGKNYILYHRHRLPFQNGSAFRQICINELVVDTVNGQINRITPLHTQQFPQLNKNPKMYIFPKSIQASSEYAEYTAVQNISDNSYATRWQAADEDNEILLKAEFETETLIESVGIRFEYPWKTYYPKVEISSDGVNWRIEADFYEEGVTGSPVIIPLNKSAAFVKISFLQKGNNPVSIWELYFF